MSIFFCSVGDTGHVSYFYKWARLSLAKFSSSNYLFVENVDRDKQVVTQKESHLILR